MARTFPIIKYANFWLKNRFQPTGVNTLFTAVVQQNSPYNTLSPDDKIDGGDNSENHMQVIMRGNFQNGFTAGNLQNVQQIDLINPDNQRYTFDAENTQSVTTWNLDNTDNQTGQLNLEDLPITGITVNLLGQKTGSANIGFNAKATAGDSDHLGLGLTNVGTGDTRGVVQKGAPVDLNSKAVEDVTITATGDSFIDMSKVRDAVNIHVNGTGDLTICPDNNAGQSIPDAIRWVDGANATGDINLITSDIYSKAAFHGGSGDDALILDGAKGNFMLHMDDVETLTLSNTTGAIDFDAANVHGVETLNIKSTNGNIVFDHANQDSINVNFDGAVNYVDVFGVKDVDVTVDDDYNGQKFTTDATDLSVSLTGDTVNWTGWIVDSKATSLTLNTGDHGTFGTLVTATGPIQCGDVKTLTINTGASDSGICVNSSANGNDLATVSSLIVTGNSDSVYLSNDSTIGSKSSVLNIDAGSLNTKAGGAANEGFCANFQGGANSSQITVTGAAKGANTISIGPNYLDQIIVVGSADEDTINLKFNTGSEFMQLITDGEFSIALGTGKNLINIDIVDNSTIDDVDASQVLRNISGTSVQGLTDWTSSTADTFGTAGTNVGVYIG